MNIGSIPSNAFPNIYAITAAQESRVAVPVSPSAYIYSQFEHVSGVPASEGESGVNINKLKIIDTLIEQISKAKNQAEALAAEKEQDEEKRINALIEQYHNQMRAQTANSNPYAQQTAPLAGLIFNISV